MENYPVLTSGNISLNDFMQICKLKYKNAFVLVYLKQLIAHLLTISIHKCIFNKGII